MQGWAAPTHLLFLAAALAFLLLGAVAMRRPAWIVTHAVWVLLAVGLVSLAAGSALFELDPPGLRLAIDPSTEPLLPRRDPALALYREAVRDFGDDEVYVIALETDDVFQTGTLQRLERVTDAVARLPGVRRSQSLSDVLSFGYDPDHDQVEVRPLLERVPDAPEALAALRQRALSDPLYRRTLVSEDGRTAAVNVSFRKMSDREFIASGLDEAISSVLAREREPSVRFHVAGRPHVKAAVYRRMLDDVRLLVPAALLAMAAVLAVVFGSVRGVVVPLATVLVANLWTFGAMAALGRPLTLLTTLLAPTLIAVGSVYGVHLVVRCEEESHRCASPRHSARSCLEAMRLPVLVAGLTSMIGFSALLVSDVPAVFELGAFASLGVAAVTVLSLCAVPALLAVLPDPGTRRPRASVRLAEWLDAGLARLGRLVLARRWAVRGLFAGLAGLAALSLPRIVIDTDYLSFFDQDAPVRREFEAVNKLLAGTVPVYVPLSSADPGRFRDPGLLRALESLQRRVEALPGVGRTESLVDTLRVLNRTLAGDDPEQERIPDSRAAVTELLFLAPKGHLDRFTNVNHSRANLVVRTGAVGTASVRTLATGLETLLADALPDDVRAGVTGNAILLARSADGIARGQPLCIGVATLAILLLVALSLRSPRLGLVAMAPNLVPVLLFFGLLGAGVAPLSLPTSLIGSVALGLAIDDTVHLLVRYREERRAGAEPDAAVLLALRRVGRPVIVTSLMLCAGFAVVALSGFATLRQFGLLSATTMGLCLATDLLLLPALLAPRR